MTVEGQCAHCGRIGMVWGFKVIPHRLVTLCHGNPDGSKADPDCYHLVTTKTEKLGARLEDS